MAILGIGIASHASWSVGAFQNQDENGSVDMTVRTFTIRSTSCPGGIRVSGPAGRGGRDVGRDTCDPGEAAAIALEWALAGSGPYVIVGLQKAMDCIPMQLRQRGV